MSEPANDAKTKRVDTDDWLGYGVYADTLWARIEAALVNDASTGTLGSDPLVIGAFWRMGRWQIQTTGIDLQARQSTKRSRLR